MGALVREMKGALLSAFDPAYVQGSQREVISDGADGAQSDTKFVRGGGSRWCFFRACDTWTAARVVQSVH